MVKLFEFQSKEVRTVQEGGKTWFSGQDVFSVLDLTWKGASNLLNERQISKKHILKKGYQTLGGLQEMTFIDEHALYKLAFRAQKSELAEKFTEWVVDMLVSINSYITANDTLGLKQHLKITVQKDFSKQINSKNFGEGGVLQTIGYNTNNCVYHTDKTPKEVIQIGKDSGLKSKDTSSAKQVIRAIQPAIACSMSLTDSLVKDGADHAEAAKICRDHATILFDRLMSIGVPAARLIEQD
jgi:prophage antirepressor-like protein